MTVPGSVTRAGFSPLPNPQTAALGAVGRGGLAGTRTRLQIQQHFSDSTKFSASHETGPSSSLPIRRHLAPENWPTKQSRTSRPARTARQYPMLNAFYISNPTSLNAFSLVWTTERSHRLTVQNRQRPAACNQPSTLSGVWKKQNAPTMTVGALRCLYP